jgi:transcription initiation factor TFIIIB Brf1 subunit/transcription initiation factor TFIIB
METPQQTIDKISEEQKLKRNFSTIEKRLKENIILCDKCKIVLKDKNIKILISPERAEIKCKFCATP